MTQTSVLFGRICIIQARSMSAFQKVLSDFHTVRVETLSIEMSARATKTLASIFGVSLPVRKLSGVNQINEIPDLMGSLSADESRP